MKRLVPGLVAYGLAVCGGYVLVQGALLAIAYQIGSDGRAPLFRILASLTSVSVAVVLIQFAKRFRQGPHQRGQRFWFHVAAFVCLLPGVAAWFLDRSFASSWFNAGLTCLAGTMIFRFAYRSA
ncbi:MAG: hypothetical protein HZC36_07960 [Armatimonadetes bacterium]|nr:hypothetical protein [Armatimonadota bacterium]